MAAVVTEITDAVVAEIEGATLYHSPTVQRVYLPLYDRAKATGLHVYVLGLAQTITDGDRSSDAHTYQIKVAVYKAVDTDPASPGQVDVAEVDDLVSFTQEVIDLLRTNKRLSIYPDAVLVGISNDPLYDPGQLSEHHVFVSVMSLQYRLHR
jgi:hypothetical protein